MSTYQKEFEGKASIFALDEITKQWQERGTSGMLVMYRNPIQGQYDVQIQWYKDQKVIWWRLMTSKLKPKGERAWVLKAIATASNTQEILAIRFSTNPKSAEFCQKYSQMFPNYSSNSQYKNGFDQGYQLSKKQQQAQYPGYYDDNGNYVYYDPNQSYYDGDGNYVYPNNDDYYQQQPPQSNPQISVKTINDWKCAVCTYSNNNGIAACGMCGLAKEASEKQKKELEEASDIAMPETWICGKCTLENLSTKKKCIVCNAPKPKQKKPNKPPVVTVNEYDYDDYTKNVQSPLYNPIPAQKLGIQPNFMQKWTCAMCTLENSNDSSRCIACNSSRNADVTGGYYDENDSAVDDYDDYQKVLQHNYKNNKSFKSSSKPIKVNWNENTSKEYIQTNTKRFKNQNKELKLKATQQEFDRIASDISCYNVNSTSNVFGTLRSVAKKLLKDDVRYRTLDTTNPKVMERLIGYEGVIDFLMLLGFEADKMGLKLICKNKPPENVVKNAVTVLNSWETKLGLGRKKKKKSDADEFENFGPGSQTPMGNGNGAKYKNEEEDEQDTLTLEQIIMWSTHETMRDAETMETLIMTHGLFTDSITLLKHLIKRFFLPMPDDIKNNKQSIIEWRNKVQRNIDLKVINSLKHWMKQFWFDDFHNNPKLIKEVRTFVKEMEKKTDNETKWMGALSKALGDELERYIKGTNEGTLQLEFFGKAKIFHHIVIPKRFRIENLNPEDLSDQITLMDFYLFSKIRPRECLNQAWKKKNNTKEAPNILNMIRQFNNLTIYIQISILKERSLKERGKTMRRIIKIGERFREQKNYNSLCAVFSALNSAPIHRLKLAWKRVPEKYIQIFEQFKIIFKRDFNHRNLRQLFRNASAPSIPHIGIFLQDLVFIDDGNSTHRTVENFVQHGKMVNFTKSVRLFDRIKYIRLYQQHPYNKIKENEIVQKMLLDEFERLKDVTEDQIWDMSTEIKKNDERDAKKWGI